MARVVSILGAGIASSPGMDCSISFGLAPHFICQGRTTNAYTASMAVPAVTVPVKTGMALDFFIFTCLRSYRTDQPFQVSAFREIQRHRMVRSLEEMLKNAR